MHLGHPPPELDGSEMSKFARSRNVQNRRQVAYSQLHTMSIRKLYSIMQSAENKLGGGEGVSGIYGSITPGGMQLIINVLCNECGMGESSGLVDVGAGLGRPLLHALVHAGINSALGIEFDHIKCMKAESFLQLAIGQLQKEGVTAHPLAAPRIVCCSIEEVQTLDPCTHAYSFWEGVTLSGRQAFGRLFSTSCTLRSVAVVQRSVKKDPVQVMEGLGFGALRLVDSFPVSMSGSGSSFKAYIFRKQVPTDPLPAAGRVQPTAAPRPLWLAAVMSRHHGVRRGSGTAGAHRNGQALGSTGSSAASPTSAAVQPANTAEDVGGGAPAAAVAALAVLPGRRASPCQPMGRPVKRAPALLKDVLQQRTCLPAAW